MMMMHKRKANDVCYRPQIAKVLGCHICKSSHFERHMNSYPDNDHPPPNHGMSAIKVDDPMHRIVIKMHKDSSKLHVLL